MSVQSPAGVATEVKVVQPGDGRSGALAPGIGVVFKIDGRDTGGALSIVEHPFEVGAIVPPHSHTLEDEISIVLEGEIGFRSEDQEVVLGPGGYIVKPRAQVHAMWNAGTKPGRIIEIITPAGLEEFFRAFVEITDKGAPKLEDIVALAGPYELPFGQPDWLPDVIARYHLKPPSM